MPSLLLHVHHCGSNGSEEDFFELMKEIQYSYDKDALWMQYRQLKNQKDYLILNIKAHSYHFVISQLS